MPERPRVLVSCSAPGELARSLSRLGLEPVHVALTELFATDVPPPWEAPPEDGVLVTSASVARLAPTAIRWMAGARVVAVGEATARAILLAGGPLPVVAEGSGADALNHFLRSGSPCFVGAARPAPALATAVAEGRVTHWPVYDRRVPQDVGARCAGAGVLDLVTLASPSAARTWAMYGDCSVRCAVIGPTTAAAAAEAGLEIVIQARVPSMEALARAARSVVSDRSSG